jgi:hypothetical protein
MVRRVMGAMVPVRTMVMRTVFHHPHHRGAAGPEKYDHQDDEDDAKNDVENRRVV